jgi:hypothetical protein
LKQELHESVLIQQQQFYLTSLCLFEYHYDGVALMQFLTAFGSHLRKLCVTFDCLLNLMIDVNNNTQLKTTMMQINLNYLELNYIDESQVNSEDFHRVIAFLFDNRNDLQHVTLFLGWHLKIYESIEDTKSLIKILSTFKHCTQLRSIVIRQCVFAGESSNDKETTFIENDFRKWLNDNTHLTFEQNFHLECDNDNKMLKLWLE